MAAVHDRMPAILSSEQVEPWLDMRGVEPEAAAALCRPCPDDWLTLDPVSPRVNDARNDGPDLVVPLTPPKNRPRSGEADGQGMLF